MIRSYHVQLSFILSLKKNINFSAIQNVYLQHSLQCFSVLEIWKWLLTFHALPIKKKKVISALALTLRVTDHFNTSYL